MKKRFNSEGMIGALFILPSVALMFVFVLIPLLSAFGMSFTKWELRPDALPKFIGLKNYIDMFKGDEQFYLSMKNTLIYTVLSVPGSVALALVVAVCLNQKIKGVNIYRLLFFIPSITAITAVTTPWGYILGPQDGAINNFLRLLGVSNPPEWLASEFWAMPAIVIVGYWLWLGMDSVIYLGGIKNVPKELYEAASIDGASRLRRFWNITVPMVSPTTFYLLITGFISSFQVFDLIYVFTQGGPAGRTQVINLYIYQNAFKMMKMGYACAISIVLFMFILLLTIFQWYGQKKWVVYD